MKFLMSLILIISLNSISFAQEASKVSYPTGSRTLVDAGHCSEVKWSEYSEELQYVQITLDLKYCQEFADYLVKQSTPTQNDSSTNTTKWGRKKNGQSPGQDSTLIGNHLELVSDQQIFVQTLTPSGNKEALEKKVISQCRDWSASLPLQETSENLPAECK